MGTWYGKDGKGIRSSYPFPLKTTDIAIGLFLLHDLIRMTSSR